MTKLLWDKYQSEKEILITFANTGCEDNRTLDFVHECASRFEWPVTWLETEITSELGVGPSFRVVNYETAMRPEDMHSLNHPFHAVIKKYGIFNSVAKSCTDKLKIVPMEKYIKSVGWKKGVKLDHQTAIGIRSDEMDRVSVKAEKYGLVYPLVDWGYTKRDVAQEIKKWGFDLQIPGDHFGNCTWCWKKTHRKHMTLALQDPSVFDFPRLMEDKYKHHKPDSKASVDGVRKFFRKYKSTEDIISEAQTTDFVLYEDDPWEHGKEAKYLWDEDLDVGSSCGESCEIGADDIDDD